MFKQIIKVCPVVNVLPQKPEILIVDEAHVPLFIFPAFPAPIPASGIFLQALLENVTFPGPTLAFTVAFKFTQPPIHIDAEAGTIETVGGPL